MSKMWSLQTSLAFLLVCCTHSIMGDDDDQRPVITLQRYGTVRGRVRQAENGARVNEFLGIPYAEPPLGDLRFQQTVKPKNKNMNVEADKMQPACPQYSEQPLPWYDLEPGQSEDCLYLNIWAPADIDVKNEKYRPVKLYVHGGGWFDGGSSRMPYYDGFGEAVDTIDEDGNSKEDGIVVVTFNYRLGALGFLSTNNEDSPGDMGLTDIQTALDWTIKHITEFGGDSGFDPWSKRKINLMTVEGQGSGAILLSLVRLAQGDNFKMVLNEATFLTLKALDGVDPSGDAYLNNLRLAELLAQKLGCGTLINYENAMSCLRGVEASRLMQVAYSLSEGQGPPNVFLPQNKGPYYFTLRDPYEILHTDTYYNAFDTMLTFTSDQGSDLLTTTFPDMFGVLGEKDGPMSAQSALQVTSRLLKKFPGTVAKDILGDLDLNPTTANREKVVQALGDAYFYCPMIFYAEEMKLVKEGEPNTVEVYMLEKQVNPPYNPFAPWMGSVGFDNVQIDFVHPDGQIIVNNETYTYTDEQNEQVRTNQELLRAYMTKEELPFPLFTLEDPAYGVLKSDGKLSDEKTSNFHKQSCDILRPYFQYQELPDSGNI